MYSRRDLTKARAMTKVSRLQVKSISIIPLPRLLPPSPPVLTCFSISLVYLIKFKGLLLCCFFFFFLARTTMPPPLHPAKQATTNNSRNRSSLKWRLLPALSLHALPFFLCLLTFQPLLLPASSIFSIERHRMPFIPSFPAHLSLSLSPPCD